MFDSSEYHRYQHFQSELLPILLSLRPTVFITLATHKNIPDPIGFQRLITTFQNMLNRKLLGKNWNRVDRERRVQMVAFPELGGRFSRPPRACELFFHNIRTERHPNLHFHVLAGLPPYPHRTYTWEQFGFLVDQCWKQLWPAGTSDTQRIWSARQRRAIARYVVKQVPTCDVTREAWIWGWHLHDNGDHPRRSAAA